MNSSIKEFLRRHFPSASLGEVRVSKLETFVSGSFITHSGFILEQAYVLYEGEAFMVVPKDGERGFDADNMVRVHRYKEGDVLNDLEMQ